MRKGLVTTNDQKPTGQGEPVKLNHVTTAIIPNAKPQPEPKGDGFAKMISTNDELNVAPIVGGYLKPRDIKILGQSFEEGIDGIAQMKKDAADMGLVIDDKVEVKINEPIDVGADTLADNDSGKIDAERVAAPSHKKAGRKKRD